MPISIQPLSDSDLDAANTILQAAFQRSDNWIPDLQMCRSLQPDGYFLASKNGMPVGMVGAIIYSDYAYVGLMAVHPASQNQGIGRALMEYLLAWLERRGVPLVKLDASPAGQPLYEKLGFMAVDQVMIFQWLDHHPISGQSPQVYPLSPDVLDDLAESDTQAFGTDRTRLLRALLDIYPDRAFLLQEKGQINGHLIAQRTRIGPWVMQDVDVAGPLLQAALSLSYDRPPVVAVPGENWEAIALVRQYGFELVRTNMHMARGSDKQRGERYRIFGQTSLFLG